MRMRGMRAPLCSHPFRILPKLSRRAVLSSSGRCVAAGAFTSAPQLAQSGRCVVIPVLPFLSFPVSHRYPGRACCLRAFSLRANCRVQVQTVWTSQPPSTANVRRGARSDVWFGMGEGLLPGRARTGEGAPSRFGLRQALAIRPATRRRRRPWSRPRRRRRSPRTCSP